MSFLKNSEYGIFRNRNIYIHLNRIIEDMYKDKDLCLLLEI